MMSTGLSIVRTTYTPRTGDTWGKKVPKTNQFVIHALYSSDPTASTRALPIYKEGLMVDSVDDGLLC